MIKINSKTDCCGCSACEQICPKACIQMKVDEEGFEYPSINTSLCINCGLCEKVCPCINQGNTIQPHKTYAAIHPDISIQKKSTSGGALSYIAEYIIANDGIVFGAQFDEEWNVKHRAIKDICNIASIRGSKYVQSNIDSTYKEAEQALKEGKIVFYCGTPCQIKGLKYYLRHEYANLITADFVCHGVPSPEVWQYYLLKYKKNKIQEISFRNKDIDGWEAYRFYLSYIDEKNKERHIYEDVRQNPFLRGFIHDLYSRPSCSKCPAKGLNSGSDFTCGDFWGIKHTYPQYYNKNGVSILTVNSSKGQEFLKRLNMLLYPVDFEKSFAFNTSLKHSSKQHPFRALFFKYYRRVPNFKYFVLTIQITNRLCRIFRIKL